MSFLKVESLSKSFGGLQALTDFSLDIKQGELIGLIGPNGAGKTTIFNLLTGVYQPSQGTIKLKNQVLNNLRPYQITKQHIARTFQNIRLFSNLTVLENIKIACHMQISYSLPEALFRIGRYSNQEAHIEKLSREFLDVFKLLHRQHEIARSLPYGEQRRLEMARALASNPELLLLDEPAAGMNPQETFVLMELINWIRDKFNLTILLIEHDMNLVMGICERLYVLEYGKLIASGLPAEIKNNPRVIEAYLGEDDH